MPALVDLTTRSGLEEKERKLLANLAAMGRVIVAFSGGTDSAYLASASLLLPPFTVLLAPCRTLLLPARGTTSTATLHRTRQLSSAGSSPTDPRVLVLLCWLKHLLPLREGMSGRMAASIATTTLAACCFRLNAVVRPTPRTQ